MDQLIIRKATVDDLTELYSFEQGVIEAERPFDPTIKNGFIHYYDLREMINASHVEVAVAKTDNKLIGSGYARIEKARHYLKHENHAYLGFMYVHPAYRGKGVNKKIIAFLKEWALSQNINEIRLDVYADNASAIRAYEKIGFTKHLIEMRLGLDE